MKKDAKKITSHVDFKKQTPEVQICALKYSELYKKALLDNDTGVSNEYCLNTASWD